MLAAFGGNAYMEGLLGQQQQQQQQQQQMQAVRQPSSELPDPGEWDPGFRWGRAALPLYLLSLVMMLTSMHDSTQPGVARCLAAVDCVMINTRRVSLTCWCKPDLVPCIWATNSALVMQRRPAAGRCATAAQYGGGGAWQPAVLWLRRQRWRQRPVPTVGSCRAAGHPTLAACLSVGVIWGTTCHGLELA
jgi:hypothetical protein